MHLRLSLFVAVTLAVTEVWGAAQTNRVSDGLLALYTFEEGGGDTVVDLSGIDPALDLAIQNTNNTIWLPSGGLLVKDTTIGSSGAASNLVTACATSGQFSVEFWLKPASLLQGDPIAGNRSLIFTLSPNESSRNVSIEQQGQLYVTRLRTTSTAQDGTPGVQGFASLSLTHLVVTYDGGGVMRLYVNGTATGTQSVGGGLTTWDAAYPLVLANEATGGADWFGDFHLVALYNRALSLGEVEQNFAVGTHDGSDTPPLIVQQPEGVSVVEPQSALFSVAAGGTQPLSYQWRRDGASLAGETGNSYLINPTVAADDGAAFDVVISNTYGVVTSAVAVLNVAAYVPTPAQINASPTNTAVTAGQAATFTVQASGDAPLQYQWRREGNPIASANQSYYVVNGPTTNDSGAAFDVVVSNAYGVATSAVAVLTVIPYIPPPPTITQQPVSISVNEPQPATFSVTALGDEPLTYQWIQRRTNGTQVVGGMAAEWSVDPTHATDNGSDIYVVLSNVAGVVTSQVVLLTVAPDLPDPPLILTQPVDVTVLEPASAAFSVQASGDAPLTYQWRRGTNLLADATNTFYVLLSTGAALDDGATFDVIISNAVGVVTSDVATLTVNVPPNPQAPSVDVPPGDANVQEPAAVSFSVLASGEAPLHYQWRRGGTPIGGATSSSYVMSTTSFATDNGATFDVVVTNVIGSTTSQVALLTVTVKPPPVPPQIIVNPPNVSVTAPSPAGFSLLASGDAPLFYQWRRSGTNILGATQSAHVHTSTVIGDDGALFDCIVSNAAGSVTSAVALLTVELANLASPQLGDVADRSALTGTLLTIALTAVDPDGPFPALSAPVMPPGASFVDYSDGTGLFSWTPQGSDIGSNMVRFIASDGVFSNVVDSIITVSSLVVTGPTADWVFRASETVWVTWTGPAPAGAVDIGLWKGVQWIAELATNVPSPANDMAYPLPLPAALAPGKYRMRVRVTGAPDDFSYSPVFRVVAPGLPWVSLLL
ncbi:MAG: hypothetical protein HQ523_02020 [Lentisphaerae bacterium]|nr:hypothetical protein [Lentisphaerota bacterium]